MKHLASPDAGIVRLVIAIGAAVIILALVIAFAYTRAQAPG